MLLAAPLLLLLVPAGCGGDESGSGADGSEASSSDQLALGERVYAQSCASCHGAELEGTDRGPSHLSIVYEPGHHPDAAFRSAIENGAAQHHWQFGPMPAVEGLDDAEIDAVIAFIRSEQQEQGFER